MFNRSLPLFILALGMICPSPPQATATESEPGGRGRAALTAAAESGKYTFILFWKQNDAPTKALLAVLDDSLAQRASEAAWVAVRAGDPAEQVVKQFNLSRSPMPMVLAVAPNGAVTGAFQSNMTAEDVDSAIVTPTMMRCMKSIQEGKLVLLCVQTRAQALPAGIQEFRGDPQFQQRTAVHKLLASDPSETRFLQDLQIDSRSKTAQAVLMAPPGVLIGKFPGTVSRNELAAKLHAAGKCCDDPNCKHNHKK